MKLHYFKDPQGNFGDDLNPWLWERLLPGFFDDDENELFVGIGTLINHRLPTPPIKHIFGSGAGYGTPPAVDGRFKFHAVRGYHTARLLNIDEGVVITDAAILLRTVFKAPSSTSSKPSVGFIPHCQSSRYYPWERLCTDLGLRYISAEWSVERVLDAISSCEAVVCEAMHGAIAADTLRVPWIPVVCYDYISRFKWEDWLSTLDLPYRPHTITSLYDIERDLPGGQRARNALKRTLRKTGLWSKNWTPPPQERTGAREYETARQELQAALQGERFLSTDALLESHTARYLTLVDAMRRTHAD